MKIILAWLISFAVIYGWQELENTNGHVVKNFLRGAWTGVLFGIIIGMLVWLVLWSIGVY